MEVRSATSLGPKAGSGVCLAAFQVSTAATTSRVSICDRRVQTISYEQRRVALNIVAPLCIQPAIGMTLNARTSVSQLPLAQRQQKTPPHSPKRPVALPSPLATGSRGKPLVMPLARARIHERTAGQSRCWSPFDGGTSRPVGTESQATPDMVFASASCRASGPSGKSLCECRRRRQTSPILRPRDTYLPAALAAAAEGVRGGWGAGPRESDDVTQTTSEDHHHRSSHPPPILLFPPVVLVGGRSAHVAASLSAPRVRIDG